MPRRSPLRSTRPHHLAALALWFAALDAAAADPALIARSGAPGMAPCSSCHGARGEGQASFPRLAGMDGDYLARQLEEFANGRRASPVMAPVAKALAPGDRVALARYYAQLPPPDRPASPGADPVGEHLALRGAWDRGVPACVQCHGPGGRGVGGAFPALAGQTAGYLAAQLRAFRAGQRSNDPQQLMRTPAAKLEDAEIDAVAAWFAAQPARRPGGTP